MDMIKRAFQRESVEGYLQKDSQMKRLLTTKDLIGLGVGTVIGSGIFILPGHEAASHAGPAVAISFLLAAIFSGIAGMAFAEFSSAMPVAGSAYSYGSVVYGELIGWLLGWSLILEYFLAVSAISTGFSAYMNNLLNIFGVHLPKALQAGPVEGGTINLLAVLVILLVTWVISRGINTSKSIENGAVFIKIAILILFIVGGSFFVKTSNYVPFYPKEFQTGLLGLHGITAATAGIIFSFLGFDTIAAHAAEVKNPTKTMAKGILGTVIISALLYTFFAIILTGIVNYKQLGVDDPAAFALQTIHQTQFSIVITIGALIGMFTAILAMVFASSRLTYSFGRDGLLPKQLGHVSKRHQLPTNALILAAVVETILAGLVPLSTLASLINIGTLTAFLFISFGIILLRQRKDITNDGFKMPLYPVLPIISSFISLLLIIQLPAETLEMYLIWLILGIVCYFIYGIHHSSLGKK
ncbi:APC family permease [Convivina praedatoris]|uniref:Amino acid permease YhdG n=1 Tax=Convivina praedatoris TaxID=2880963 RepID=A0ABN8HD66_9LACO|nr:amino acid permease [Convivina sp. LMG 32447]CAH1856613.1 putative amino acid permease YhdG [Convivina sp. LMG 32447]CAH1857001.1 putative amino acid permease YhdG [Convivina sp. LMG 32447]CAH1857257.1 putative amino acid permease YhdG [Convivina sp. LMG 32447]